MAKKTVATLHEGSKDGRAYTKVIKMVKSPKTGLQNNLRPLFLFSHLFLLILRCKLVIYGNFWFFQ